MSNNIHNCTLCGYDGGTAHNNETQKLKNEVSDLKVSRAMAASGDRPYTYFWSTIAILGISIASFFGFSNWLDSNHSNPELVERQEAHSECMTTVRNTRLGEAAKLEAMINCNDIMNSIILTPETDTK